MKAALLLFLLFLSALPAAAVLIQARVVQEGEDRYLVKEDGERLEITSMAGRAPKTIAKAIADGYEKWVLYNEKGNRVQVVYIDDQPPLTPEQVEQRKQDRRAALAKLGLALRKEFTFVPGALCTPRGEVTVKDDVITLGDVVVGRFAPKDGAAHFEALPMEQYRQVVRVTFDTAEDAQNAVLRPLPMYAGRVFAYTCRWDDNNSAANLRNCKASGEVGVYATCFLNGIGFGYTNGVINTNDVTAEGIREILATGSSIGNHSQNHNWTGDLRTLPNDEQFREVYRPRVEREAQGDCLIMTVAPPHNRFGDHNTLENWRNAGHYAFANDGPGARGFPADNVVIIRDTTEPLEFFGAFHAANLNNPISRAAAVEEWKMLAQDPRIWQANFNQYAAYRYQYQHTVIGRSVEGATAVFTLYRPLLLDLNDPTPLTFAVTGKVRNVAVDNGRAEALTTGEGLYNIFHDPAQFLPSRIGLNADGEFPGIGAALRLDGERVTLNVKNASKAEIRDLTVSYRFPNGWSHRVARIRPSPIPAGAAWTDSLAVKRPDAAAGIMLGAQLDFRLNDERCRLHVTESFD